MSLTMRDAAALAGMAVDEFERISGAGWGPGACGEDGDGNPLFDAQGVWMWADESLLEVETAAAMAGIDGDELVDQARNGAAPWPWRGDFRYPIQFNEWSIRLWLEEAGLTVFDM